MSTTAISRYMLCAYADHLGIAHTAVAQNDGLPMWDGQKIWAAGMNDADFAHEIAHWLVADTTVRNEPNFGLGHDADYGEAPVLVENVHNIEVSASTLGICLYGMVGGNWTKNADGHGWYDWNKQHQHSEFDQAGWSAALNGHQHHLTSFARWLRCPMVEQLTTDVAVTL